MRRKIVVLGTFVISVASVMTFTTAAWARPHHSHHVVNKSKKPSTILCKELTGTLTGTTQLADCTGGNTGGGSKALGASIANGGTITWLSGSKTTVGDPTLTAVSTKSCPKTGGPWSEAQEISAAVTADTGDGIAIPGTFTGIACLSSSDNVATTSKGFKIT